MSPWTRQRRARNALHTRCSRKQNCPSKFVCKDKTIPSESDHTGTDSFRSSNTVRDRSKGGSAQSFGPCHLAHGRDVRATPCTRPNAPKVITELRKSILSNAPRTTKRPAAYRWGLLEWPRGSVGLASGYSTQVLRNAWWRGDVALGALECPSIGDVPRCPR